MVLTSDRLTSHPLSKLAQGPQRIYGLDIKGFRLLADGRLLPPGNTMCTVSSSGSVSMGGHWTFGGIVGDMMNMEFAHAEQRESVVQKGGDNFSLVESE